MGKHIVFFSHSSVDGPIVASLREMILQKTGKSFDIFASSDGESIPFGTNWIHELEIALDKCDLMFVFISSRSIRSHWVFFESGFAYAKGKKVIPVGIGELDLGELRSSPLGNLQGFNLNSGAALNNIISRINSILDHTHDECYSQSDYEKLISSGGTFVHSPFGKYTIYIDEILFWLKETSFSMKSEKVIPYIEQKLIEDGTEHGKHNDTIFTYGLSFGWERLSYPASLVIRMDPSLARINLPIVEGFLPMLCKPNNNDNTISFEIIFNPNIGHLNQIYKISSHLYNTDISIIKTDDTIKNKNDPIKKKNVFAYDNIDFMIDKYWRIPEKQFPSFIAISYDRRKSLSELRLFELIHQLFDNRILFQDRRK